MNRRHFIKQSTLAGTALLASEPALRSPACAADTHHALCVDGTNTASSPHPASATAPPNLLPDLRPARWIWYPSERCLQNTFVLFRRVLALTSKPLRARGWICADSRYKFELNGQRIQWGPAPCDPRWLEADPLELTEELNPGENVLSATVLFYGQGDGTWPAGKPGFLFWLEIEDADGSKETVVSDASWQAFLARAWRPGQFKRWYLRALQEEFDARLYPQGWTSPAFRSDTNWLPAMPMEAAPNKPAIATSYYEYMLDIGAAPAGTQLRPRTIPLLEEQLVPVQKLTESLWLDWLRPPQEYFECRVPNAFREIRKPSAVEAWPGEWHVHLDGRRSAALTFEFGEQVVGWPYFTIEAPAGTTIELLVQEAHQVGGPALLNTHFDSWTRFICRDGLNRFETFDFESCRWLQLNLHNAAGLVKIRNVGLRRRKFPWPNQAQIRCSEPGLQRLFDASLNTLHNCAQETCVDGMARERQQYSGDGAHQLHAIYYAFGETRLPARFLNTFSQGLTTDGYFLDCWPAYDRLARLIQRQLHLTSWGPILDHGIGFNFDCYYYYLYTGDLDALREPYPRLLHFAEYIYSLLGRDGLLPVENLGVPSVWIDHAAYQKQRHKQCAFNLYAAAMMQHALAPLCRAFGEKQREIASLKFGADLQTAVIRKFWSKRRELFVNNLPWLAEEKSPRLCDRSLATAILFDQCPRHRIQAALGILAETPPEMGFSYPANAGWRLWALAKGGRPDTILHDLRTRWATMSSVLLNNTLQEDWIAPPDSGAQWSHCAVVPLYLLFMSLAGIRPLEPGFTRVEIRPQLADLGEIELTAHTVRGPIRFQSRGTPLDRELTLSLPAGCKGEIVLPKQENLALERVSGSAPAGHARYHLPAGETWTGRAQFPRRLDGW